MWTIPPQCSRCVPPAPYPPTAGSVSVSFRSSSAVYGNLPASLQIPHLPLHTLEKIQEPEFNSLLLLHSETLYKSEKHF